MISSCLRMLLLLVVLYSQTLSHAAAKDTTAIMLFGDSIIAGYGLQAEEAVPSRLQEILQVNYEGIRVINGGVSGDTTGAGRSRLAWMLDKHTPDIVVLALGGNDVLRGIPPQIIKENLTAMLELLKKRSILTILSTVEAPANLGEAYRTQLAAAYKEAARVYDVRIYPFLLRDIFGKNDLMQSDAIHPNAQGATLIARNLAKYLERVPLLKLRQKHTRSGV